MQAQPWQVWPVLLVHPQLLKHYLIKPRLACLPTSSAQGLQIQIPARHIALIAIFSFPMHDRS